MAGVAIEGRVFRIPSTTLDTTFIDACVAFLTPKMALSQVLPSGCNLRRVTTQPKNQLAVPERPSASTFNEEETVVDPSTMLRDPSVPAIRGDTGKAWMTSQYGITADTSSLISSTSGTERDDTDEEILSFDLLMFSLNNVVGPQKNLISQFLKSKMADRSEITRNAIQSEFRTSKITKSSHFEKKCPTLVACSNFVPDEI